MHVTPYLFFNGTCRAAMTFYAQVLGAEAPVIMAFADMPEADRAGMPGVPEDAVMHARVTHGDLVIMASDDMAANFTPMAGNSVQLTADTADEARRIFTAFAEGGEVRMPMAEMFWVEAFGLLSDRFGTRWMISAPERA